MCQPEGVYRADGAMGQFTIVVPDLDMLIAITENASGAHWAQAILDTMWAFLERIRKNPASGENKTASDALKKRMSALSLPAPKYHPFSPYMEKVDGSSYQVEEGNFYLGCDGVEMIMGGTRFRRQFKVLRFILPVIRYVFPQMTETKPSISGLQWTAQEDRI